MWVCWTQFYATPANPNQYHISKWHLCAGRTRTACGLKIPHPRASQYCVDTAEQPNTATRPLCKLCLRTDQPFNLQPPTSNQSLGAKPGNISARKHGAYAKPDRSITTIDDQIAFLEELQDRLAKWLHEQEKSENPENILKGFALLAQNVSRLARLIQARALIQKPNADWLDRAIEAVNQDIQLALEERARHVFA